MPLGEEVPTNEGAKEEHPLTKVLFYRYRLD